MSPAAATARSARRTTETAMTDQQDERVSVTNRLRAAGADAQLIAQLNGFSLTTAEITYRMPDARRVLQTFLWQEYDQAPRFPKLGAFLGFWERELDGPIHSVRVASSQLLRPLTVDAAREFTLH